MYTRCNLGFSDATAKKGFKWSQEIIKGLCSGSIEEFLGSVRGLFSSRKGIVFLNTDEGYTVLCSQGCSLSENTYIKGDLRSILERKCHINGSQWYLTHLSTNGKPFSTIAIQTDKDTHLSGKLEGIFSDLLSLHLSNLLDNLFKAETGEIHKALIENIPSAIIVSDLKGKITCCNEAALRLYCCKKYEVLGKDMGTFLNPFSKNSFSFFLKKLKKHASWKDTSIGLRKDGSRLQQEFTLALLKDNDNKPTGIVATLADTTDRVRKELCVEVLQNINKAIVSSLNLERIIKTFAKELRKIVDFDGLALTLFEKAKGQQSQEHYIYPLSWKKLLNGIMERFDFSSVKIPKRALCTSVLEGSALAQRLHSEGIGSYLLYPVNYLGETVGILLLCSKKKERFRRMEEREILTQLTPQVTLAIQNAKIHINLKKHLRLLQQLCFITFELTKEIESADQLFQKITKGAASLFNNGKALLCLANWGPKPQAVSYHGLSQEFIEQFLHIGHKTCPCDLVCTQEHPVYLSTVSTERDATRGTIQTLLKEEGLEGWLSVPIKGKAENIGYINLFFNENFTPDNFYLKLMEMFAYEAAVAIRNAQLYKKLRESEELYKELYDQAPCMYYSLDENGVIIKCNNAGMQFLGHQKEQLVGNSFFNFLEETSAPLLRSIIDSTKEGHPSEGELTFTLKEGYKFYTTVRATQANSTGEKEIRVVLSDITAKKRLCERFNHTEKLMVVGQLTSGIAHDFNNFLTVILGNVHLINEIGLQNKELKDCVRVIKKAALDGAETVRRLKEFTKIRAGSVEFVPLNISHIIKEVINYTRPRWKTLAQAKGVTYHLKFKKSTDEGWVLGNSSELKEVFLNIINNALDAMPEGGNVSIKTFKENGSLSIHITDTGIGMPEEVLKRVFDPFFTTKGEGSGLGMSVAYGIVAKHRGEITLESRKGVGTTAIVKLPNLLKLPAIRKDPQKKVHTTARTKSSSSEKSLQILVVDDDEETCNILTRILLEKGHHVIATTKGKTALNALSTRPFEIVFCDLAMPEVSGWDIAARVKELRLKRASTFPLLVLVTGIGTDINHSRLKETQVDSILEKPFLAEEVLAAVEKAKAGFTFAIE